MAPQDRPAPQHLSFLTSAGESPRLWGLFSLLRGAEARAHGLPRVGKSRLPKQNVVDLTQTPMLGFQPATLEKVTVEKGRARVEGHWLGLTGTMGPLPGHMSEFAFYERRYAKSRPFGRFLDLLAGRMLQLFYRAWADSQPAAIADRPDDDRFADYLAALTGAAAGVDPRSPFPARARLHYAALYAGRRSAASVEDAVSHLLGQRVRVREFQPRWRDIAGEDQSRLGGPHAALGQGVLLGQRVRTADDAFRVVVRAASLHDYESLMPDGVRFAIAAEALDSAAPSHLEWEMAIEIDEPQAPPAKLDGRARLGWTSWVAPQKRTHVVRADAHLTRTARRRGAAATRGK